MPQLLTDDELLTFCGLARLLIRLDGSFTSEEWRSIDVVGPELAGQVDAGVDPYRSQREIQPNAQRFWDFMDRAADAFPDAPQVRAAALALSRPDARETIYGALFDLASSDAIDKREWELLTWLEKEWGLTQRR